MAANSAILKIIVRECCRSLSYDVDERQFSFTLQTNLSEKWRAIRSDLQKIFPHLYFDDFNDILSNIINAVNRFHRVSEFGVLSDAELMNGELIECRVVPGKTLILVRMEDGQYLDVNSGRDISVGEEFQFKVGSNIIALDGSDLGLCSSLSLLVPQDEHIALSRQFIGTYYKNGIASSLWSIYNKAVDICSERTARVCDDLLLMAKKGGINSFTLLNILKGAAVWQQ